MFLRFTVFSLILFVFIANPAVDAEQIPKDGSLPKRAKITWLLEDKKENIDLLAKVSPDTSVATYIESKIVSQLTGYDIKISRVSMKRIDHYVKNTPNSCVANRARIKSREAYSLFSTPQSFYITHKLYRFNRSDSLPAPLLNEDGEVIAIKDIFHHFPKAKIGIADGVSFGQFLDREIKRIPLKNIHYRSGANRVTALEAMLYSRHIDYLLALPIDIVPNVKQKTLLEKYTIAGAPPYLIAYFSCSKSELGKKVISDINTLLNDIYQTQDYYSAHQRWFTGQELIKLQSYLEERYISDVFLKKP